MNVLGRMSAVLGAILHAAVVAGSATRLEAVRATACGTVLATTLACAAGLAVTAPGMAASVAATPLASSTEAPDLPDSGPVADPADPASPVADPAAEAPDAPVVPGHPIRFPADYGNHPQFRTEWWYITGWLRTQSGESVGFQITFFRTKPSIDQHNPSAFAPRQLLVAHCALSDTTRGRLWQDQRIRRAGLGLAQADEGDTHVWIDNWSLERRAGVYQARIAADNFSLLLAFTETQAALINGDAGVSRKGPAPQAASYYYSLPHMRVAGRIVRNGKNDPVTGEAWFDHEWSSEYLDPQASGWDWIGINLDDGGALMAFRIRDRRGEMRWAGGTLRGADGGVRVLAPADIEFRAQREWTSPRTGIKYPVQWTVRAGPHDFEIEPLMDDQENDTRLSTGAIYWEGAVRASEAHRLVGRGYLELTGYGEPLRLR